MTRTDDRRERTAALRRQTMDDVARRAQKHFDDTRLDGLRGAWRRPVIVGWGLLVLGIAAVTLRNDPLLNLACLVVGGVATWLLRRLVRAVPDLPDEVLDERQTARRDRAYRYAYQALTAIGLSVTLVLYVLADGTRPDYAIQPAHVNALFMVLLFGALGLPSAVFGWSEQEL